ncbi:DUF4236 domain-containing protein [Clostridium sp. P21]|uniref:DUF4236 domain-containing protein n=1 Tax=Clostridium muellerianum TaxID=2716538 RepID=A0A7Y0EFX4_9CLOT|nr:DUF4236 domain-containing protein [Clostridium muellerianum]NMM62756.1 DUF4236 domain-containing protein [Clostridium muellerianum]
MGTNFKKTIKIGRNIKINFSKTNGIDISTGFNDNRFAANNKKIIIINNKLHIKLNKNIIMIQITNTLLLATTCICLFLGFTNPVFLIAFIGIPSFVIINKRARQRMFVAISAYNLQRLKLHKAEKYMQKAKKALDNKLIYELKEDIDNAKFINSHKNSFKKKCKLIEYKDIIFSKQIKRNLKARELEKQGDINNAVKLYELNVKEGFSEIEPYERLVSLYRKQKKYSDEIRIINRTLELFENTQQNEGNKKDKLESFKSRLEQINILKDKQS